MKSDNKGTIPPTTKDADNAQPVRFLEVYLSIFEFLLVIKTVCQIVEDRHLVATGAAVMGVTKFMSFEPQRDSISC